MNNPSIPKRIPSAKPGDLYEIPLPNSKKGYFQYLMIDPAQLNSEVIRVFKKKYNMNESIALNEIIADDVIWYMHTTIPAGIKQGLYYKIGNVELGNFHIPSFRSDRSGVSHYPGRISDEWYIWRAGDNDARKIGYLSQEYKKLDIGGIFPPSDIIYRMNNGKSEFLEAK